MPQIENKGNLDLDYCEEPEKKNNLYECSLASGGIRQIAVNLPLDPVPHSSGRKIVWQTGKKICSATIKNATGELEGKRCFNGPPR